MTTLALWFVLNGLPARPTDQTLTDSRVIEAATQRLTALVASSGRVLSIGDDPRERLHTGPRIAPGAPPLLRFRYLEGKRRHRFGNLDLVMDDAGHE
jgi:hypothetical protein